MNPSKGASLVSRLVTAALIGVMLGLVDFLLFELRGSFVNVREYVLYKPGFFGLSMLSLQLLSFSIVGVFCWLSLHVFGSVHRKLARGCPAPPSVPLFIAVFALGVISLRVYLNSGKTWGLAILTIGLALVGGCAWLFRRVHLRPLKPVAAKAALPPRSQVLVLLLLVAVTFLAPDLYSLYLRFPYQARRHGARTPNILFVVMDTVRADHLSCYGYQKMRTPNIDRLSREGVLFLNAFSAAPWTAPSQASMFTGLYPSQHHTDWGHIDLDESFPTLAARMRDAGYLTIGFSENPSVGRWFGHLDRGFSEFHDTWRRPLVVRAIAKIGTRVFHQNERVECAERSIGLFERWVSNNRYCGTPFFAYMNFMAAHGPRYPRRGSSAGSWTKERLARIEPVNVNPQRYYLAKYKLTQEELGTLEEFYDADIAYLDSQIGNLVSFLAREGVLDQTIVILTSDHGENFGEHGFFEHQFVLYNTLLHVPLVIRYPALWEPKRIEKRVSTVFLFDTVLAMAGAPRSERSKDLGADPLAQMQGQEFVIAECGNAVEMLKDDVGDEGHGLDFSGFDRSLRCVIEGDYKLIWASNGKHELYRIKDDFGETDNLIEKKQDQARVLGQLLESWELSTPKKPLF